MKRHDTAHPFGLSDEAVAGIIRLCSSPDWPYYAQYLDRLSAEALVFLRKRNQSVEDGGFFKGILQIIEDQKAFPFEIAKTVMGHRKSDDPVSLDEP